MTKSTKKTFNTDKSVVDHPQQVIIDPDNDTITVKQRVGRLAANTFSFLMKEWASTEKSPTFNPAYNKYIFIYEKTAEMDEQPGGSGQAQRIRDSIVNAIDGAFQKMGDGADNA